MSRVPFLKSTTGRSRELFVAISCLCISVFSLLVPSMSRAEMATEREMDQVCRNWLVQVVQAKGNWAGSTAPEVTAAHEIYSGDTLLARYYDIVPTGFVVVPVLKEMRPIKAYSDVSILDDRQEGGFLSLLREMLSDRVGRYGRAYGSMDAVQPPVGEAIFGRGQKSAWEKLTQPSVEFKADLQSTALRGIDDAGPLLTSTWHQGAPYKNDCPVGDGGVCVVGCVATAAAQILNFWQWPPAGTGSYEYEWSGDQSCGGNVGGGILSADFSDDIDWDNILDNCDAGCSAANQAAMAELNSEVGVAFNMNYGYCASGASVSRALTVFPTFYKYKNDIARENRSDFGLSEWFGLIQEEINNGRPIQYRINLHSIVCDGWRDLGNGYEYHMNYGWGGSFNAWFVLDSLYCGWILPDSICPADEEFMITHIEPQTEPDIRFIGHSLDDTAGDGDGHADAGETSAISVTVQNDGWNAENLSGVLSCDDPDIEITTGTTTFDGTIPWGALGISQTPFVFTVAPECPDPSIVRFYLEVSDGGGYSSTDTFLVFVGDTPGISDDIEGGVGYWMHESVTPAYADEWHQCLFRYVSPGTSWKAGGPGSADYTDNADGGLITPPFLLPWQASLTFQQWLDVEVDYSPGLAWDGGVVMISSGDGNWEQITPVGGYPYSIIENPASPFEPGTPCFAGISDWSPVIFDLSSYSGVVQLMFRFGSDGAVTEEGWYIDDIEVTGLICGDANDDGAVNVGDAVFLIGYIFKGGSAPEPLIVGDVNCDGAVNVGDAVFLINYVFKGGNEPCTDCP